MDIGMLWFDDDAKRGLDEKVTRAAAHYRSKYGVMPTLCYVHPAMLDSATQVAGGVVVCGAQTVMLNHFWLGVGEAGRKRRAK